MKRFGLRLVAVSSLLLVTLAGAATRPRYGGTLRVATHIAPLSLDPADNTVPDSIARRNITALLFDTLVTIDDLGRLQPALALSWQVGPDQLHWQFHLRPGVRFDDGALLNAATVAASLRTAHPGWKVYEMEDSVALELESPDPLLPAELAQARYAIARRSPGKLSGTGPFRVTDFQPGKSLLLAANEEYWGGRPFVDAVQIDLGRSYRDQLVTLDLRKADAIDVPPDQARRATMESRRLGVSAPIELVAVVFARERRSAEEGKLRDALALSIDRASIRNVLLQGEGESGGGILPNWMTGYAFLFPTQTDMRKAQQERAEVPQAPSWTISYDVADPVSRLIAERIALNAKDAGLRAQTTSMPIADMRLVRIPLASTDPRVALTSLAGIFNLPTPKFTGDSAEAGYQAENGLLQTQQIIPLFHLPVNYGLGASVKHWTTHRGGTWGLDELWLVPEKP
jgi:peptide/nickel transport system substrate-binding protein